jgi:hypothetical protein
MVRDLEIFFGFEFSGKWPNPVVQCLPGLFLCLPVPRLRTKKSLQRPVERTLLAVKQHQRVNEFLSFQRTWIQLCLAAQS